MSTPTQTPIQQTKVKGYLTLTLPGQVASVDWGREIGAVPAL